MSKLKKSVKHGIHGTVSRFGRAVQIPALQDWFINGPSRLVLDEAVIPRGYRPRPLWRLPARTLCDPYRYVGQRVYWFGRFHELHLDNYMRRELKPGDTLIDIGTNRGNVATIGACLVGPKGRVIGFEVRPALAEVVTALLHEQGLTQAFVHPFGLSDVAAEILVDTEDKVVMQAPGDAVADAEAYQGAGQIKEGDAVLMAEEMPGRVMMKIDVEGHELRVIRGMPRTLRERVHDVALEITPDWIGGPAAVEALVETMAGHGFAVYAFTRSGRLGKAMTAAEIAAMDQAEVLFRKTAA